MSDDASVLSTQTMQEALVRRGVGGVFAEVFESLPSTSEYLSAIAGQQSNATPVNTLIDARPQLCVADWQTNGNGRRGKSWVTDRGNVTFSLLLPIQKPPAELLGLSLVTGICVAESLKELAGVSVQLKWPNDVLVDDKKLCGLLTELVSNKQGVTQVCVGVGINYKPPATIEGCDYETVSLPALCQNAPSRADVISDLCARLLDAYSLFAQRGWPTFAGRWDQHDYLKGRQVRVINAGEEQTATAIGVDHNGALLVEQDGQTRVVYSGDVSVRRA